MTRHLSLLVVIFSLSVALHAQQASAPTAWDYIRDKREGFDDTRNVASKFTAYDFCHLCLLNQQSRLGYIGKDFQRFYIYFSSISKDSSNPNLYSVRGKSRVKNNICDFAGTMQLLWVRRVHARDGCENDIHPEVQGISFFRYEFKEDAHQKHTGEFRGTAVIQWYLDSRMNVCYDDTWGCSDFFDNNSFVGTWTSYSTHVTKPCNWGDARIPFSDSLDCGAGEFHPDDQFLKSGWDTYSPGDTLAWWK